MSDDSWRGKVGALARDEVDEFLAEGRIARLGCLDADGWPYVVPVWHEWDGSAFWVVARRRSIWASYLQNDGRCSVAIDEDGRQRKVLAQCRAEVVEEPCLDGRWVAVAEEPMPLKFSFARLLAGIFIWQKPAVAANKPAKNRSRSFFITGLIMI